MEMTPQALEQFLTQFLHASRQAETRYNAAVATEQACEDATQDVFHCLEFSPKTYLSALDVTSTLTALREERRTAKLALEVYTVWKDWAINNKKSVDALDQILGQIRKRIKAQPGLMYSFKSSLVAPKGSILIHDPETPEYFDADGLEYAGDLYSLQTA